MPAESHTRRLRFFGKPSVLGSGRPYKYFNAHFSPKPMGNDSMNSKNCTLPFQDRRPVPQAERASKKRKTQSTPKQATRPEGHCPRGQAPARPLRRSASPHLRRHKPSSGPIGCPIGQSHRCPGDWTFLHACEIGAGGALALGIGPVPCPPSGPELTCRPYDFSPKGWGDFSRGALKKFMPKCHAEVVLP